jgi:hypothetical protein
MSYVYGAPSKAGNLTSYIYIYIYIYMDEIFYWGFCFLNRAFRKCMLEKPTNTPIIHSVY